MLRQFQLEAKFRSQKNPRVSVVCMSAIKLTRFLTHQAQMVIQKPNSSWQQVKNQRLSPDISLSRLPTAIQIRNCDWNSSRGPGQLRVVAFLSTDVSQDSADFSPGKKVPTQQGHKHSQVNHSGTKRLLELERMVGHKTIKTQKTSLAILEKQVDQ